MEKPDSDFDKFVDLEPSEFRPIEQPEPFFGWGARHLLIELVVGIPIIFAFVWITHLVSSFLWPVAPPWWAPLPPG